MNQLLFERSTGFLSSHAFARKQSTRLLHDIQLNPRCRFRGEDEPLAAEAVAEAEPTSAANEDSNYERKTYAHRSGVNALVAEQFDRRLLVSGGADGSIKLWDAQKFSTQPEGTISPEGSVARGPKSHKYGITALTFYPFDSAAFLSSSYDHTLNLYSTSTLSVSASFDLGFVVYTHALSPIASHLLVACGTQHPAVRLVDLRSGSSSHSLAGHHGGVLSVGWSPTREYVLASGDANGVVRVWDVRKSAGTLGVLDLEDSIGSDSQGGSGGTRSRFDGKAHNGAVNGLTWTDDGQYLITAGHDQRVRVWDAATGANTLASFGPTLKNAHLFHLPLLVSPTATTPPGQNILFYPNETEILMFSMHEGRLQKRLRVPGPVAAGSRVKAAERNVRNRITSLTWGGVVEGMYSGHSDGLIRVWAPRETFEEGEDDWDEVPADEEDGEEQSGEKRKRKVLDDIFRDLTRTKITFG